jgi:hypothetical protein
MLKSKNNNGWINHNLKGKVISFLQESYLVEKRVKNFVKIEKRKGDRHFSNNYKRFDNRGNLIENNFFDENGVIHMNDKFTYNDNNELINIKTHEINKGIISINKIEKEEKFYYDKAGKEIKIKKHCNNCLVSLSNNKYNDEGFLYKIETKSWPMKNVYGKDREGNFIKSEYWYKEVKSEESYEYNRDSQIIKYCKYDSDNINSEICFYDENNNLIEKIEYQVNGKFKSKKKWKYNKKGKIIEFRTYDSKDSLVSLGLYKYNEFDYLIKIDTYNENQIIFQKDLYHYDDFLNLVKIENEHIDLDDNYIMKFITHYKYDEQGNWIQKIEIEDFSPTYLIEREYKYFE